jgi:(p)ppGpp synthase/HD superfamily hydrolase
MPETLMAEALSPADRAAYADAIDFATERHRGQCRKGSDLPYVGHPLEAGALLAHHYPDRPALVTAGFLHDTLEDTSATRDELRERFGEDVARLVGAVTQRWWKVPWSLDVRDPDVVRLKTADCISNIRATIVDLRRDGPVTWRRFNGGEKAKRDYYRRLTRSIVDALRDEPLVQRLLELARMLDAERPAPR